MEKEGIEIAELCQSKSYSLRKEKSHDLITDSNHLSHQQVKVLPMAPVISYADMEVLLAPYGHS